MANDNWEYALDMDKLYGYEEVKWWYKDSMYDYDDSKHTNLDEPGMPSPEDDEDDIDE